MDVYIRKINKIMFKKWDFLFPHQLIQRSNKGMSLPPGLGKVFQGLAYEDSWATPVAVRNKGALVTQKLCE